MEHFKVLGLGPTQRKLKDVKSAYHRLAMKHHPDKAGPAGLEDMKRINIAYHAVVDLELYDPDDQTLPQVNNSHVVQPQNANRTQNESPSTDQRRNEATQRSDGIFVLRATRSQIVKTRQDLIRNWRDDREQSLLLDQYDQKLAMIDQRIAEIEAERMAMHDMARQQWEDEMLASVEAE